MKVAPKQLTPAETLALAEAWYMRQMSVLAQCYGPRWPEFRDWISDYLHEEIRQRLKARGWTAKP